ncbi:MAG TPA: hypothetical protein VF594_00790, partial [Rubricoccaceae bacterium]
MTGHGASALRRAVVLGAALAGCGAPPEPGGEIVAVDSALGDLLADLALAAARVEAGAPRSEADSLRAVALTAHGVSSSEARRRQDDLAADPVVARAT